MESSSREIQTETTINEEVEKVATEMRNMLNSLDRSSKCCIYKVPEYIRKGEEECYRPLVISIGPVYYKSNPELETMQKFKWMTLQWFLNNGCDSQNSLEHCLSFIREKEDKIRECYQEKTEKIPSNEFIQMILLDAALIIYEFLDYLTPILNKFIIPEEIGVLTQSKMGRDLFLVENQLPYFILKDLYDISFGGILHNVSFIQLTRLYMGSISQGILPGSETVNSPVAIDTITEASDIKHLVDFLCCCLPPHPREKRNSTKPGIKAVERTSIFTAFYKTKKNLANFHSWFSSSCLPLIGCKSSVQEQEIINRYESPLTVQELSAAGVKFQVSQSKNPLDICYANGVLEIPKINLEDVTESIWRNIMFFEQCHYIYDSYFIDYVIFLDALINTVQDIQILVESKILHSMLGSHEEVVDLFNNITKNSTLSTSNFYYSEVSRRLNAYARAPWNKWRAILKKDYFNHPWSIISVISVVVLLILTILQVYTGFKGLKK